MPNSRSTGRYLHVAPDRLASARAALEALAGDIARLAIRPLTPIPVTAGTAVGPPPVAGQPLRAAGVPSGARGGGQRGEQAADRPR